MCYRSLGNLFQTKSKYPTFQIQATDFCYRCLGNLFQTYKKERSNIPNSTNGLLLQIPWKSFFSFLPTFSRSLWILETKKQRSNIPNSTNRLLLQIPWKSFFSLLQLSREVCGSLKQKGKIQINQRTSVTDPLEIPFKQKAKIQHSKFNQQTSVTDPLEILFLFVTTFSRSLWILETKRKDPNQPTDLCYRSIGNLFQTKSKDPTFQIQPTDFCYRSLGNPFSLLLQLSREVYGSLKQKGKIGINQLTCVTDPLEIPFKQKAKIQIQPTDFCYRCLGSRLSLCYNFLEKFMDP